MFGRCGTQGKVAGIAALAAGIVAGLGVSHLLNPGDNPAPDSPEKQVLDITMNRIDGTPENLAETYAGKAVLVVNVASKCGLTPQYEGLEALYRANKDSGFVVLGFPANNFMGQEPGTNEEIAEFCTSTFDVTFPMFEKISVKGDDAHELYRRLGATPDPNGGAPGWNFTKWLIGTDGQVIKKFGARTSPSDPELIAAVQAALPA
ncbi:MAG: glutathione peroxidase [Planctomycetota bacterium]